MNKILSNFIENATLSYVDKMLFTDDSEMAEILTDDQLLTRLRKGSKDAKEKKGEFVA